MAQNNNLSQIGYVQKVHGLIGALKIQFHPHFNPIQNPTECIFLGTEQSSTPFFVTNINHIPKNQAIVLLEDVDSMEKAEQLKGYGVFTPKNADQIESNEDDPADLVGYEVIDANFGSIGRIIEVMVTPQQNVLVVHYENKEVLLPFVDEFLESKNDQEQKIYLNLPEGLLDVYL